MAKQTPPVNLLESLPADKLAEYCRNLAGNAVLNRRQAKIFISVLYRPATSPKDIAAWSRTRKKGLKLPNVETTLDGSGPNRRRPRYRVADLARVAELRAVNVSR